MTLRHLEIFQIVCAQMSITKAADELNMTQPAVSIAVKELESFYRTKLFDRLGRKIYLTRAGEKLLAYTNMIIGQFHASISDIRNEADHAVCRIGVNVTAGEGCLAAITVRLKEEIPNLKLHIAVDNTESIQSMLRKNEIDFAVMDAPSDSRNLTVQKLYSEQMTAVCSQKFKIENSIKLTDLAAQPLLVREEGSGLRKCVDRVFEEYGCFIEPLAQSVSNLALIELAKSGLGIAILPASLASAFICNGSLKKVNVIDAKFIRDCYLVRYNSKYLSETLKKCISLIIRCM